MINSLWTQAMAQHQALQWQGCLETIETLLQKAPHHLEALRLRGDVLNRLERWPEAITAYQAGINLAPHCFELHHELGRLLWARQSYKAALGHFEQATIIAPQSAQAWTDLGVTLHMVGNSKEAILALEKALDLEPDRADTLATLGIAYGQEKAIDRALDCFKKSLGINPRSAQVHSNYGAFLAQQDQIEDALWHYEQAIALQPDLAHAYSNLGVLLKDQGKVKEGIFHCRKAIELNPNLAEAYTNLSLLLKESGELDEAIACCHQALALNPHSVNAYNNLGNALQEKNELGEAIVVYGQAIALLPEDAKAYHNLANALQKQDALEEAIRTYHKALEVQPGYALAYNNLGNAYLKAGDVPAAIKHYQLAIDSDRDYAEAHFHLGMAYLCHGDLQRGWIEYEWRWKMKEFLAKNGKPQFKQPQWDGSLLEGKSVLLFNEQGMGDRIQFIRYASLIEARGGRVLYECPQPFLRLFASYACLHEIIPEGAPLPDFDYYVPLQSLPAVVNTSLSSIPGEIPYLFPPFEAKPSLVQTIGESTKRLKVGIVWASSLSHKTSVRRSIPLSLIFQLLDLEDIQFFSLQKDMKPEDLERLDQEPKIINLNAYLSDFADTATAMQHLDLVITVDTAVAHLAGALGKPLWILLSYMPDWRWMLDREDSPWYPTARLFRQQRSRDWEGVIEQVKESLASFVPSDAQNPREYYRRARSTSATHILVSTLQQRSAAVDQAKAALAAYQSGDFAEAARLGKLVLEVEPNHVDVLNLMGVSTYKLGDARTGADFHFRALALDPDQADIHSNLALILDRLGEIDRVIHHLECALALKPTPEIHNNLGNALQKQGKYLQAIEHYRWSIQSKTADAKYHFNLGNALKLIGEMEEARECMQNALQLNPNYARALDGLGLIDVSQNKLEEGIVHYRKAIEIDGNNASYHLHLGNALAKAKQWEPSKSAFQAALDRNPHLVEAYRGLAGIALELKESENAITYLQQALELTPHCADTRVNLGVALIQAERFEEAQQILEEALGIKPDSPEAYINLGVSLNKRDLYQEACPFFQTAIELNPEATPAYLNLGLAQAFQEKIEESIHTFRSILTYKPDHPDAHMNVGIALMTTGDLQQGWAEYEWRHQIPEYSSRAHQLSQPLWDGKSFAGKILLIYTEQGLGDCIQFMRYLPLVKAQGGTVIVECNQSVLRSLMETMEGVDEVYVIGDELPPFDFHYPLMSIPNLLGISLDRIPHQVPYLSIPPHRVALPMADSKRFKVGVVWTANLGNQVTGKKRSIPLSDFQLLFNLPGIQFYLLQKDITPAEHLLLEPYGDRVLDLSPLLNDLLDTGALLQQLDLVITIDTMVGHLAGALNQPVWIILPFAPDWRWMLDREDSPWYPSVRLCRRWDQEDWIPVLQRTRQQLQHFLFAQQKHQEKERYQRLLARNPDYAEALNNLGTTEIELGEVESAVNHLRRSVSLNPQLIEAAFNLGTALLLQGKQSEGFELYRLRWQVQGFLERNQSPHYAQSLWDGEEDLTHKSLYIHPEQGFGDQIQFIRYLPLLKTRVGKLLYGCTPPLIRLFREIPAIDDLVTNPGEMPSFDRYLPLGDLPGLLGEIPSMVPYLEVQMPWIEACQSYFINLDPKLQKIGVVWQTNSSHPTANRRSCPLGYFHLLFRHPHAHFFILQKDITAEDRQILAPYADRVTDLSPDLLDFATTAAVIKQLDLVITIDTAVAHLAGALGVSTWVLLPDAPDWRWGMSGHNNTWYPTLKLFRQTQSGDWQSVIQQAFAAFSLPHQTCHQARVQRLVQLATDRYQHQDLPGAIRYLQGAVSLHPNQIDLHLNIGGMYGQLNQLEAAIPYFEQILSLDPDHEEAKVNLARVYYNLGNQFNQKNELKSAISAYLEALAVNPHFAKAHTNLGIVYGKVGDLDRAIHHYHIAMELHPNHAEILNNLGTSFQKNDRFQEAIQHYRQALELNPQFAEAHSGVAAAYRESGDIATALQHHQQALDIQPSYANAHFNLAQTLLLSGKLAEGFAEYEWRFRSSQFLEWGFVAPNFSQPEWEGSDIQGQSILILTEQGAGDQIHFIRYAKLLKDRGAKQVFYVCPDSLITLFESIPWIDQVIAPNTPLPPFDRWISLMSLPHRLSTTLESIPQFVPYLSVPFSPPKLSPVNNDQLRVGLVWATRSSSPSAAKRSCPIELLEPLFLLPSIQWVSLQKEVSVSELAWLDRYGIEDSHNQISTFYDTALKIQDLDLVITIDTAVAHLAGAMGKPTWVMLLATPDWRWMLDREDSPWYPSLRLFRQPDLGNWNDLIQAVRQALLSRHHSSPSLDSFDRAVACYHQGEVALAHSLCLSIINEHPHHGRALHLIGVLEAQQNRSAAALPYLWRAISLLPQDAGICHALGAALLMERHLALAVSYLTRSLQQNPNSIDTLNNLSTAFTYLNQLDLSRNLYEQIIKLEPGNPEAHFGLAMILLKQGHYSQGFQEYEWRWQRAKFAQENPLPQFEEPRWDGSSLEGKTLLIVSEQGIGDQIQYLRFLPLIKHQGCKTLLYTCSDPLVSLLESMPEIDQLVKNGSSIPPFDLWIPLMSLPGVLGITLGNLPAQRGYLTAPPLPEILHGLVASAKSLKIGIVWASKPGHETTPDRSIPFSAWKSILALPGIQFYSLQKEVPPSDESLLAKTPQLIDLRPYMTDIGVTTSIIAQLDGVISVDTAVAHLTGALGKTLWILLPWACDWRWMSDREDSPWYPTARLIRQPQQRAWSPVLAQVCDQLQCLTLSHTTPLSPSKLGIAWPAGYNTGWGVFGMNLTLQLLQTPHIKPFLLAGSGLETSHYNPIYHRLLSPVIAEWQRFHPTLAAHRHQLIQLDIPVIHALGNGLASATHQQFRGSQNIGFVFFENTLFSPEEIARAQHYDCLLAGSTWNTQVLKRQGIAPVHTVLQGIDPTLFHPAPKSGLLRDRFVIFSGGKIEFRKGQDIVIAAFRMFRQRHPEAFFVFAWHNFWSQFMLGMEQMGHVEGLPQTQVDQSLDISSWLIANGIPQESFMDVGLLPNYLMPLIYREMDVAIFANRCEGGTNLVAMECLACGIPTLLSANTGHLDLIDEEHCYPLSCQRSVPAHPFFPGTDGWGESDPEEIVEILEQIYADRDASHQKGKNAAKFMQNLTWEKQIRRLLEVLP